ncbi:MAG: hypothetical protein GXP55_11745, partial [Deltaproteobacteria bacterium]|nr:hypothetical protein [Deltaproteobacteria bacterium]
MRATFISALLLLTACASVGATQPRSARPVSLPSGESGAAGSRAQPEALPPAARFSQAFEPTAGGRAPAPSAVVPTPDGGVVVALNFSGETRVERRHFRPAGGSDGVVVAFRPDGRVRWARVIGGAGNDGVLALAVGEDGRVAAAGVISGSVELNRQLHTGGTRFFLATFDADGAPAGFTQALSTSRGWSQINDLSFTTSGDLVAVGSFNGQLDVAGAASFHTGYWNGFVARFDGHGRFSKGARALQSRDASLLRVAPTSDGGFVVAGRFRRRVRTGVGHHRGAGGDDTVLVRYDAEGEPVWSRSFGRSTDDVPHSLAVRD